MSGGLLTAMVAEKRDRFFFVTNQRDYIAATEAEQRRGMVLAEL
jgi:hypothetical protein